MRDDHCRRSASVVSEDARTTHALRSATHLDLALGQHLLAVLREGERSHFVAQQDEKVDTMTHCEKVMHHVHIASRRP